MKGATAWEWQWGYWHLRIVHLMGGRWKWWNFWDRVSLRDVRKYNQ